ncbi:MAG: hypothetical protein MI749_03725 [Desulfovibrionales bacterium]|nr:hypothetical protein [Desulfovibrionales bacterium]
MPIERDLSSTLQVFYHANNVNGTVIADHANGGITVSNTPSPYGLHPYDPQSARTVLNTLHDAFATDAKPIVGTNTHTVRTRAQTAFKTARDVTPQNVTKFHAETRKQHSADMKRGEQAVRTTLHGTKDYTLYNCSRPEIATLRSIVHDGSTEQKMRSLSEMPREYITTYEDAQTFTRNRVAAVDQKLRMSPPDARSRLHAQRTQYEQTEQALKTKALGAITTASVHLQKKEDVDTPPPAQNPHWKAGHIPAQRAVSNPFPMPERTMHGSTPMPTPSAPKLNTLSPYPEPQSYVLPPYRPQQGSSVMQQASSIGGAGTSPHHGALPHSAHPATAAGADRISDLSRVQRMHPALQELRHIAGETSPRTWTRHTVKTLQGVHSQVSGRSLENLHAQPQDVAAVIDLPTIRHAEFHVKNLDTAAKGTLQTMLNSDTRIQGYNLLPYHNAPLTEKFTQRNLSAYAQYTSIGTQKKCFEELVKIKGSLQTAVAAHGDS